MNTICTIPKILLCIKIQLFGEKGIPAVVTILQRADNNNSNITNQYQKKLSQQFLFIKINCFAVLLYYLLSFYDFVGKYY